MEIHIGPAPWGETCAQAGTVGYADRARMECEVFRRMLLRLFPVPEGVNARLRVKGSDHDFGTYYEVVAVVNDDDQQAMDYAMAVKHGHPERWDAVAVAEMLWFEERAASVPGSGVTPQARGKVRRA
jgi:hypothetical protein